MNALLKIISLTLTLTFYLNLQAAYLTDVPVKVTQPDGIVLNIFATGDEFYSWLHDENGYTIVQDQTNGFYCYAELIDDQLMPTNFLPGADDPQISGLAPDINLPPEILEQNIDIFTENVPASITREDFVNVQGQVQINNIVVYIRFADQEEFTKDQSIYTDMFNKTGENVNSVTNYFKESSYNKLDINSTFYPANDGNIILSYQDSHDRSYYKPLTFTNSNGYAGGNDSAERIKREHELVSNAMKFVKAEIPADLNIDFNNDNIIDNISFILKGDEGEFREILWPHRFALYTSFEYINGKRIYDYIFLLENRNDTGIACHEITHVFGAPDLYHRYRAFSIPVGRWDVMANNNNPPQHTNAYIKYRYCGWIDNIPEITTNGTYSLNPLTMATNNCYKIPLNNTNEYLLFEFRLNIGIFESQLPDRGLLIYRINENYWGNFIVKPENSGGINDEVYIFRPGGSIYRKGDYKKANFSANHNRKEFSNTTDPFCFISNGSTCEVAIKNITAATGPRISFTVDFCDTGDIYYDNTSKIPPLTNAPNITATGQVILEAVDTITFEANEQIELNGGFEVKNGGVFTAKTVECNE